MKYRVNLLGRPIDQAVTVEAATRTEAATRFADRWFHRQRQLNPHSEPPDRLSLVVNGRVCNVNSPKELNP